MTAIVLSCIAILVALVSLVAIGTLALKLRLVQPKTRMDPKHPEAADLSTIGKDLVEVLGASIEVPGSPNDIGALPAIESFLLDDGPVLVVSTSCGACRYLLRESEEVVDSQGVRVLVYAPSIDRGIEFMETECGAKPTPYQVDDGGARTQALGIRLFPSLLIIRSRRIIAAYSIVTSAQLNSAVALSADEATEIREREKNKSSS